MTENYRSGPERQRKAVGPKRIGRKATVHARSRGRSLKRRSRRKSVQRKAGDPRARAQKSLQRFRQASILAVVLTAFLLIFFGNEGNAQQEVPDTVAVIEEFALEELQEQQETGEELDEEEISVSDAAGEAMEAVREMLRGFMHIWPRALVAIGIFLLVWLLLKAVNFFIRRTLRNWDRIEAITTLVSIVFWLVGIGLVVSILAGDIRALIGSLGLVGLALSWALQSPIESATGWLLNKFKGYYRVGDRVVVGDVFGDVYKIDLINTTLWEVGDPFNAGFVNAEQPTGRLVTFPNSEILNGIVVNLTSDYPYVWDEMAVQVANESDLKYAMQVFDRVAHDVLDQLMKEPAKEYARILTRAGIQQPVPDQPQLYLASQASGTDVIVRYLVPARERRKWKSELAFRLTTELNRPEHHDKILTVYPRHQVQLITPTGRSRDLP